MNRKRFMIYCASAVLLIISAGCEELSYQKKFYEYKVRPSRTKEIVNLEPEKMTVEAEIEAAEPNVPEKLEVTLEESRAFALENNLDLKVQLVSPAIAQESVNAERAKFEWAFVSDLSYTTTDTPTSTALQGSMADTSNYNYGVRMPLRTGGEVTFNLGDNRNKTNNQFTTLNPSYSTDLSVSISQPLLRNAGRRVNTHSIRVAEYEKQIVDARTKLEAIRVLAAADRVYWRLYAARRELAVRRKEYELAEAQLERARRFVEAGERSQIEVIRAEAGLAQTLEGIIIAENELRDRERELKRILNIPNVPIDGQTVMSVGSEPDPVHYNLDAERLLGFALENRMELLELELQIAEDVSRIDYLQNQALPLVTAEYTYNINGLGETRGRAYDLMWNKDFEDHRVGLQILIPLGNEAAKSRLRGAFHQRMQRLISKKNRTALIESEVLNAIDQLEANWQRVLASRQRVLLEGRLFEAEKRQFELGLNTSNDVLEAQTQLADAQSAEITALVEYEIALVDIAYATGTVLGAARIDLGEAESKLIDKQLQSR